MSESNQPPFISISGLFKIARVGNLIVIFLTQYLTAIFLIDDGYTSGAVLSIDVFLIILSTILIAAAGYLINDYYDVKIDLINKPEKVVIGKLIRRRSVMLLHTLFNFTGIALGFWVSYKVGLLNFGAAFLLWLYSNLLKRTPLLGNLVVGLLTGLTVFIIGIYYNDINMAIILYSVFAFTSNLFREIIKDIEDLQGDEKFGAYSLPIAIGVRRTKGFLLAINIIFLGFLLYLIFYSAFPGPDLILYFFSLPVVIISILLIRADKKKDFSVLSSIIKWFMLIGISSMALINYTF